MKAFWPRNKLTKDVLIKKKDLTSVNVDENHTYVTGAWPPVSTADSHPIHRCGTNLGWQIAMPAISGTSWLCPPLPSRHRQILCLSFWAAYAFTLTFPYLCLQGFIYLEEKACDVEKASLDTSVSARFLCGKGEFTFPQCVFIKFPSRAKLKSSDGTFKGRRGRCLGRWRVAAVLSCDAVLHHAEKRTQLGFWYIAPFSRVKHFTFSYTYPR